MAKSEESKFKIGVMFFDEKGRCSGIVLAPENKDDRDNSLINAARGRDENVINNDEKERLP